MTGVIPTNCGGITRTMTPFKNPSLVRDFFIPFFTSFRVDYINRRIIEKLRMKMLSLFFVFTTLFDSVIAQEQNPFVKLQYDSVVIYDFGTPGKHSPELSIINKNNQLASTVRKKKKLTSDESKKLTDVVGVKSSYGQNVASCFDPHLGIVYYKNGMPNVHITVCMDCNRLESSVKIPAQDQGKQISEEGSEYYILYGMSKTLRKQFRKLLLKYDFSHQAKQKTDFD
jgi:hypothetical protein